MRRRRHPAAFYGDLTTMKVGDDARTDRRFCLRLSDCWPKSYAMRERLCSIRGSMPTARDGFLLSERGKTLVRTRLTTLTLVVALAVLGGCGGSPTAPGSGTGSTCRTFATTATANGFLVTSSFNSSTRQLTATTTFPGNANTCVTVAFNYSSIADFVDEVSVVPPRALLTQSITSSCAGAAGTSTRIYMYDGLRRLTQEVQDGQTVETFTAWDSWGRPTAGMRTGGTTFSDVYDNASRTDTSTSISNNGVTTTVRVTYDANGIILSPDGIVTWTINSTGTVCK
jgi:hypothetical protein